jgi:hypothetical protein
MKTKKEDNKTVKKTWVTLMCMRKEVNHITKLSKKTGIEIEHQTKNVIAYIRNINKRKDSKSNLKTGDLTN